MGQHISIKVKASSENHMLAFEMNGSERMNVIHYVSDLTNVVSAISTLFPDETFYVYAVESIEFDPSNWEWMEMVAGITTKLKSVTEGKAGFDLTVPAWFLPPVVESPSQFTVTQGKNSQTIDVGGFTPAEMYQIARLFMSEIEPDFIQFNDTEQLNSDYETVPV